MKQIQRTEEQLKYIALNTRFLEEVAKGKSWDELQPILDEMKSLGKHIDDIEATNVFMLHPRKDEEAI